MNVSYTFVEYENFLTWMFYAWIFSNTKIFPITLCVGVFCIHNCLSIYEYVSNMTAYVRLCVCLFVYVFFLYECMYTCVCRYVYVRCECVYVWVCMYECLCLWVCTRVCTYVCLYVFVCACVYVYVCVYFCVYVCVCAYMCAFVYVCIRVCMCVYIRTCVLQLMPTLLLFLLNCSWRCDYHSFAHFHCYFSLISYWQCMPSVQETCTNPRKGIFRTLYNFFKSFLSPISSLGLLTWCCIKHVKLVLDHTTHQHCCALIIVYAMLVRCCSCTQLL